MTTSLRRIASSAHLALLGFVSLTLAGCGTTLGDRMREPLGGGLCGLIILILNIVALVEIWRSSRDTGNKIIWSLVIWLLPLIGLILYYFIGRRSR
jgi:hypothetical protein